jgi:aryl-alcohol dehydrogenase-like predicted oxidoreductase
MKKVLLGNTGFKVSRIGFGGIPIGRLEHNEAVRVVRGCLDMGVNFLDTAVVYGDSEVKIGEAISGYDIILATKSQSRDAVGMEKDVLQSLSRMKVNFIHLYQLHAVNDTEALNKVLADDGALNALKKMKKKGAIGAIGITGHRADILVEALKTGEFETVQVPYNFIETEPEKELFPLARRLGIGVIAMKPLGGGILENVYLAMKYILKQKNVVPIPGIQKIEEMEQICGIARRAITLSVTEKEQISKISKELGKNFCRRCGYCMPCPRDIQIVPAMNARIFVKLRSVKPFIDNRGIEFIKKVRAQVKTCIKCGQCESHCPYNLPIRETIVRNVQYLESILLQSGQVN